MDHEIILKYLQVLLNSWPLIILIFVLLCRKHISNFLERIYKGSFYGASFEATPMMQKEKMYQDKYSHSPIDKAVEYIKNNPREAFDEYVKIYKYYIFERAFHFIYGTQINLLEYLVNKENNSENKLMLKKYYNEYLMRTNPKYSRSTPDQYFGFLHSYKLIEDFTLNGQIHTKILDLGKEFLVYIKNQFPLISKPY